MVQKVIWVFHKMWQKNPNEFFGQPNNWGRKHFLEVRKGKGIHLAMELAKSRLLQMHHHLVVPRRERLVSQSHPVSSEMGFGKSKYSYTLHHPSLSYCFCGSVLLPKFTERRVEGRRKDGYEWSPGHHCYNHGQSFTFHRVLWVTKPLYTKLMIIITKPYWSFYYLWGTMLNALYLLSNLHNK